jgi:hypothetical protein
MIAPPSEGAAEEIVLNLVLWLKLVIEAMGALFIGVGTMLAGVRFFQGSFPLGPGDFLAVRLTLARFLAIALEF